MNNVKLYGVHVLKNVTNQSIFINGRTRHLRCNAYMYVINHGDGLSIK